VKTFESSGWDIVHQDENQIEAKRKEFQLLALLCYYLLLIKEGYYKALYDAINIAPHCFWLTI
jgi:hypothetical protein